MPRIALIVAITISILAPQQRELPSVVGARSFSSLDGRFSISLPGQTGFGPLVIPTPFGDARGVLYEWDTIEATFGVGHADAAQSLEDPEVAKAFFKLATDRFNKVALANNGSVAAVKQISLGKHPGIEQRVDLFTGTVIQRAYIVSRRVYEIVAVMKTNQRVHESIAVGALDSFKVLSDDELKIKQAEQAAKAQPSPLPQTPVAPRAGTDARDEGLRGPVKSVLTETQELVEGDSEKERHRDTYNEQGNLVKSEWYDDKGNVGSVKVYGYIDGSRVSTVKDTYARHDPLTVKVETPPGSKAPDPRFQYKCEYKYDQKKRLIEETTFLNDGELWMRTVYKYGPNHKEKLDYSEDGRLGQRVLFKLDEKGNEVQETVYNSNGEARYKTTYVYEFDAKGNWTKRTAKRVELKYRHELPLPDAVSVRTITYY